MFDIVNMYVHIEYFSLIISFLDMNMNSIPIHMIQGMVTIKSIKIPNREKKPDYYCDTKKMQWDKFSQRLEGMWEMGNNSYQPVWGRLYKLYGFVI